MAVIALLFWGEEDYQTDRARTVVLLVQVKPVFLITQWLCVSEVRITERRE
jgi:hypothetical protein